MSEDGQHDEHQRDLHHEGQGELLHHVQHDRPGDLRGQPRQPRGGPSEIRNSCLLIIPGHNFFPIEEVPVFLPSPARLKFSKDLFTRCLLTFYQFLKQSDIFPLHRAVPEIRDFPASRKNDYLIT